jgi:xylulokinase
MDPINIIGGGAQSDIWCQIYADVLNRTIRRVRNPIMANARGSAFIAAVALGHCSFEDIPRLVQYSKTFIPNPDNRKLYDTLFKEFINLYKNNKAMSRRLNE